MNWQNWKKTQIEKLVPRLDTNEDPFPSISHKKVLAMKTSLSAKAFLTKTMKQLFSLDLPVGFPSKVYQVASEPIFPIDRFPLARLRCKTLPFNHIFKQTPNLYLYLYFYLPVFPSDPARLIDSICAFVYNIPQSLTSLLYWHPESHLIAYLIAVDNSTCLRVCICICENQYLIY